MVVVKWFQRAGIVLLVGVVGISAWRHRDDAWVQALWRPEAPPKPVVFDNGSVRAAAQPMVPASAAAKGPDNLPGQMKKCIKGKQVVYTDQPCEAGAKVASVSGGNVTVVPSIAPKPAAPAQGAQAPSGRSTLHDALDLNGNDNIRDKMMERAINR
jgi:hypothetical protein